MKRLAWMALLMLPMFAACTQEKAPGVSGYEGILRAKSFEQCMNQLPAGPVKTHYNDWSEVVSECTAYASWQVSYCEPDYEMCLNTLFPKENSIVK